MTKPKRVNLDVDNKTIWESRIKNLLLTKEPFRDLRWLAKMNKAKKELKRLSTSVK